ncbi:hypothetical protein FC83_GL002275 [Agrilactobacillus composti DSM 18527 = JCM 14202]|uniref:Integral membrane protein n=1 Tax=Agrilactobacillus composti DSM 18527 = JCM 14202 TaxID=1423734 RepID=X0PHD1_9LACO|nr:hypothetical protein [Agrilactobacillus composti]KRM36870.1 hypothetical protein FC83_GL002275 [Agrilactobacillus composti DSM 18527 = JCM 14202]GAF41398.1 hypothetical protein JCM14202_3333 [Agrilactobacillus composti DSM 18527 = JCM 14202]
MHLSIRKFPALFDILFLIITLFEILAIIVMCLTSQMLDISDFFIIYSNIADKIFWIFILGIGLHIFSYLKSLDNNWLLFGNLFGIFGFLIFWILPQYFFVGVILHWVAIHNLIAHAKLKAQPQMQSKTS